MIDSDISRAWSDASIDDIASMKETMKSLLQLDTSAGDSVPIRLVFVSSYILCSCDNNLDSDSYTTFLV